jgi:hypothetical protein
MIGAWDVIVVMRVSRRDCTKATNAFMILGVGRMDGIFPTISVVIGSDLSKVTLSMLKEC